MEKKLEKLSTLFTFFVLVHNDNKSKHGTLKKSKNKRGSGKERKHRRRKYKKSKKGRKPPRRASTLLKGLIRR